MEDKIERLTKTISQLEDIIMELDPNHPVSIHKRTMQHLNDRPNKAFQPQQTGFEFQIGDVVYLRSDSEQLPRMVTGINIRPVGNSFILTQGVTETWHYAIEISSERDILKALS